MLTINKPRWFNPHTENAESSHSSEDESEEEEEEVNDHKEPHVEEQMSDETRSEAKFVVMQGNAGTGKTFLIKCIIAEVLRQDYNVLVATPTVKLADTYQKDFPCLTCKSIYSAFSIPVKDIPWEINWNISWHQLIVIDEIGQVNKDIFNHVIRTITVLPSSPLVILLGDSHQALPLVTKNGKTSFDESVFCNPFFKSLLRFRMYHCHRSVTNYTQFLDIIRYEKPSNIALRNTFSHCVIPENQEITKWKTSYRITQTQCLLHPLMMAKTL